MLQKRFISLLLCLAMVLTMLPMAVFAYGNSTMSIRVKASQTEVTVGDQIDYTIYATGTAVIAMEFDLVIPEGLTYVAGSGATPAGLKNTLGWAAADWTESSKRWTGYNDEATSWDENAILTFSCIAQEEGSYEIVLYELLSFDDTYEECPADLTVDTVRVGNSGAWEPTEGTEPPADDPDTCSHSFTGNPVTIQEPTCTQSGRGVRTCVYCGIPAEGTLTDTTLFPSCTGSEYVNGMNKTFSPFTIPGASRLVLHFSDASFLEKNYDKLYIYAGRSVSSGNLVATCTGSLKDTTVTVDADAFTLVMVTDSSTIKYGFEITAIDYYITDGIVTLPALGHSYDDGVSVSPTCTEQGRTKYTCTRCSYSYTVTDAPATGHSYDGGVSVSPTCTEQGRTKYTCTRCSYSYTVTGAPATGHSYDEGVEIPPTCTEYGHIRYTCQTCGYIRKEQTGSHLAGHTFDEGVVTKATCTEPGYTTYTCNQCGITKQSEDMEPLGHEFVDGICGSCGIPAVDPEGSYFWATVKASKTEAEVGDVIDFTVYGYGNPITALQFELRCPDGLSYVEGSAVCPKGLKEYLGWAAAEWTEGLMMWTGYNDLPSRFEWNTVLLTFSCVVEKPGSYDIELFELLPFDAYFQDVIPDIRVDTVLAGNPPGVCAHDYVGKITTEPTCTTKGVKTYTCSKCGHAYTEAIDTLEHTLSFVSGTVTCTEAGDVSHYMCSGCGKLFADASTTVELAQSDLASGSLGHDFVDGTCSRCNMPEVEPEGSYFWATVEASKTEVQVGDVIDYTVYGYGNPICALQFELRCPNGLSYVEGSAVCPEGLKDYLGWAAAEWTESSRMWTGYNDRPATFEWNTVLLTFSCVVKEPGSYDIELSELLPMDAEFADVVPQIKVDTVTVACPGGTHSWLSATCTEPETCEFCGLTRGAPLGHQYDDVLTAPTCTAQGYTTHTCHCGDTYIDGYVPALGHREQTSVVKPTCTVSGTKTHTCSVCGNVRTETLPATGHSYQSTVIAPTCTTDGYTQHTCANCSSSYPDTYVPATGHSHQAIITAPTCISGGFTTHICHCGDTYTDSQVPALGHREQTSTVAPTCTAPGIKTYTCSVCGNIRSETIPATGHSHRITVVEPTCTAAGYTQYTCHCGDEYIKNLVQALGHQEQVTTLPATCTENGLKTFTCTRCGIQRTEAIPATGHSYGATVIAPTCTVSGYTYHECGSCGNNYVDTYVPATGHRYQAVVTPPTATEQGYTTYTCAQCADSYITNYTAPLGLTLTGSFISGGEGKLTFELLQEGQVVHSITVDGKTGSYSIPFILPGDYTLKVSKGTHTFREYPVTVDANPTTLDVQLCLIGDITGDGRVNVGDVSRLYSHARKTNLLSGYPLQVAELTGEGRVNVGDVSRLYAHARKTDPLF